ncbi:lasso peptide biosynthesis B2 protein [Polymorphobacter megasporae]|uniref:lasso peptide biosynthesis B2 protein n=1 Tax=Glacieibacterium megasporae TaxID=2835787 RepID=UPI001C1E776D|nr:lasso peptide biosynthesis B2 protein [Polymorphobacter megasporae]UAJ12373.1 lasso peptide biosynthesis B2 protein [Polymorphobacter megasporae]
MTEISAAGIFAVRLGDDVVFLDVATDTYSCVLSETDDARGSGPFDSLTPDQIAGLVTEGLLTDAADLPGQDAVAILDRRRWCDLPAPSRRRPLGIGDWLTFARAQGSAARLLRGDSLAPALAAAERLAAAPSRQAGMSGNSSTSIAKIASAVARFDAMAIWLPQRAACVAHALALMHFLWLEGIATDWIFGVHLYPFRAHCWLAAGEHVVGDASHRVLAFAPIMAVSSRRR